jgi:hypothetical protein
MRGRALVPDTDRGLKDGAYFLDGTPRKGFGGESGGGVPNFPWIAVELPSYTERGAASSGITRL